MLPLERGCADGAVGKRQPSGRSQQERGVGINIRDEAIDLPCCGPLISRVFHPSTPTKTRLPAARTAWRRGIVLRCRLPEGRDKARYRQAPTLHNLLHCKGMFCVIAANPPSGTPCPRKPPPWPTRRRRGLLALPCGGPRPTGVPARDRPPSERSPRAAGRRTGRRAG